MSTKAETNKADRAAPAAAAQVMGEASSLPPTASVVTLAVQPAGTMTAFIRRPVCAVRLGRGRLGGSTGMDLFIQRARFHGRRVKPLDGDLRSRTLATLYPAHAADGSPIPDGASMPRSEDMKDYVAWLKPEFDRMVEDGVSVALDLGGGERVMQEFVQDFPLSDYCDDFGVDLLPIFFLGPDIEDLNHVVQVMRTGALRSSHMLLVLNEGVIRAGQTPDGVFDPIVQHPDFQALLEDGVESVLLRKLHCLDVLRERRFGFYDAAYGRPDPSGKKASPTLQFTTKLWLAGFESQVSGLRSAERLP
jgi:hypothetical protein